MAQRVQRWMEVTISVHARAERQSVILADLAALASLEDELRPGEPRKILIEKAISEIPAATVTPPPEAL